MPLIKPKIPWDLNEVGLRICLSGPLSAPWRKKGFMTHEKTRREAFAPQQTRRDKNHNALNQHNRALAAAYNGRV